MPDCEGVIQSQSIGSAAMADRSPVNRNVNRRPVRMAAQCRSSTGLRDEGWLEDISAHGCCLVTRTISFRVDSRIVIRPQGLEGVTGVVRWISGTKAGVEFDHPLYPPMVEHLWNTYGAHTAVPYTAH
jgi:hypothetical protein